MVDRKYIVEVLNRLRNPNMTLLVLTGIIREYCLEKGKKEEDVDSFISAITTIYATSIGSNYILKCGLQALEYYKKKFNICELSYNSQVLIYY